MTNFIQFAKGYIKIIWKIIWCRTCKRNTEHRAHGSVWVCTECGRSVRE